MPKIDFSIFFNIFQKFSFYIFFDFSKFYLFQYFLFGVTRWDNLFIFLFGVTRLDNFVYIFNTFAIMHISQTSEALWGPGGVGRGVESVDDRFLGLWRCPSLSLALSPLSLALGREDG